MPVETALWRLRGTDATSILSSAFNAEKRLEDILAKDLDMLGLGPLLLIGRQVTTAFRGIIDLLALSSQGDIYVIELKKERTRTLPACGRARDETGNPAGLRSGRRGFHALSWSISPRQPPVSVLRLSMNSLNRWRSPFVRRFTSPMASPTFSTIPSGS